MWPPISRLSIASACSAASSAPSANLTPPAFMRPPVSTCDLITVGPPIRSATSRAWAALVAKPKSVTGIPALFTIWRDSYSKKRTSGGGLLEPVGLRQLGVLLGELLRQRDHHLALLPGGVVLHLAVDHVNAAAVRNRLDHLLGEAHLLGVGREDLLGDLDLHGVQRPGADAAQQEGGAELGLAAGYVLDVAVGISSRLTTPWAVSRIACTSIGRSTPAFASSWASRRST